MKTKQIILAVLDKTDLQEQKDKVVEEVQEMFTAYNALMCCKAIGTEIEVHEDQFISECYDVIQAVSGMINIVEKDVSGNYIHLEKIRGYVESGRVNNKARRGNENI